MLSVIVPVYNTKPFLRRCIDSILNQSYRDWELLLIDDGSSDGSGQICDSYAKKDARIRVIHKKNEGASAARNAGLETASGDYITFVDSDDWIEPVMYEAMMLTAVDTDCDVVMCDCLKEFGDRHYVYTHPIREGYYSSQQLKEEYYPHLLMMENLEYPATISNWLMIFRIRKDGVLLPAGRVRYLEGIRFSEDLLFGAELMLHSNTFYYLKGHTYYHYYVNHSSVSHTLCGNKWNDYIRLYNEAEKRIHSDYLDFREQLNRMLLFFLFNAAGDVVRSENLSVSIKLNMIKNMIESKESKVMLKNIRIHELNIPAKQKALAALYKSRGIYLYILIKHCTK